MSVIAVIDYDVGNIKSICNAFEKVGANVIVTRNSDEIFKADGVVLPGVGAFAYGMQKLKQYDLDKIILEVASSGKPLLGICLGMQMLFSSSEEFGNTTGLGIIPGEILKLSLINPAYQKLPHVSWNELNGCGPESWGNTILKDVAENENMYFVHSFFAKPDDEKEILSTTVYSGHRFCSTVQRNNVYGCQYHPEKSAIAGLKIITNFKEICEVGNNV